MFMISRKIAAGGDFVAAAFQDTIDMSSSGNVDSTLTGLGWTPKAGFTFFTGHAANDVDPVAWGTAYFSLGVADGTSQHVIGSVAESGAVTNDSRHHSSSNVLSVKTAAATSIDYLQASLGSFIADGERLNVNVPRSTSRVKQTMFFGGDNTQAKVGSFSGPTALGTVSVSVGFEPDLVIFLNNMFNSAGAVHNTYNNGSSASGLGFATWDGATVRQCCHAMGEADNSTFSQPVAMLSGAAAFASVTNNNAAGGKCTVGNFSASGFDATEVNNINLSGETIYYLALKIDGQAWCGMVDLPTTTGLKEFTEPGFTPKACILLSTARQTTGDVFGSTGTAGSTIGMSLAFFDADREMCVTYSNDRNNADPKPYNQTKEKSCFIWFERSTTTIYDATFDSMGDDGPILNFATAAGVSSNPTKAILVALA